MFFDFENSFVSAVNGNASRDGWITALFFARRFGLFFGCIRFLCHPSSKSLKESHGLSHLLSLLTQVLKSFFRAFLAPADMV